eukprot:NODE_2427_length_2215_cov_11.255747.p1 GENE.NODE_2427_length_2215_cov_11.255747~~NODE_2427_length_2215_cov_11.255747.p1  ORF type:complete len:580 (-),score=156.54 NODE_2427_length_2215_cov_11.255747:474-2183(-)
MPTSTTPVSRLHVLRRHVLGPIDVEDLAQRAWPDADDALTGGCGSGGCSSCGGAGDGSSPMAGRLAKFSSALGSQPQAATLVPWDKEKRISTAEDYVASLLGRSLRIYYQGELLGPDYPHHPVIWPTVNSLCETYRFMNDTPNIGLATGIDGTTKMSRFLNIAMSADELVLQSRMQRELGRRTGCCFQRCVGMDAINAMWSTTFDIDKKHGTSYHQRFRDFVLMAQRRNIVIGGAMTDPKGDRALPPSKQEDPDLFTRMSSCNADGSVVLRGAKMHQTGTINSHWMLVMPGGRLSEKEKDYAVACAVPVDAPGITYIYGRQSCDLRAMDGSEIDQGNAKFGANETIMIFENVVVPPEHVFMCGEIDFTNTLVERFTTYHRRSYICKAGLGDVMLGAAATISEYNGASKASHVKDKLVEISYLTENIAGTALAASYQGTATPSGNYLPDVLMANICKHNVTRFPYDIARMAQDIAGGLLVTLPGDRDFQNEVTGPLLNKFLSAKKGVTVENRRRILRLIENMTMGRNAIGFLSESMHGAGSPQAQRVLIQRLMDVETKKGYAKAIAGIVE